MNETSLSKFRQEWERDGTKWWTIRFTDGTTVVARVVSCPATWPSNAGFDLLCPKGVARLVAARTVDSITRLGRPAEHRQAYEECFGQAPVVDLQIQPSAMNGEFVASTVDPNGKTIVTSGKSAEVAWDCLRKALANGPVLRQ